MRYAVIAAVAGLLLIPATAPAKEFSGLSLTSPQTAQLDLSAAKKKKEKVEYMKSAAGPDPMDKPKKKKKKKKSQAKMKTDKK